MDQENMDAPQIHMVEANAIDGNNNESSAMQTESTTAKKSDGTRKRRLTSHVWEFFDILPFDADKKERAKCKKCSMVYLSSSANGTGNMQRHIKVCAKRSTRDIGQLLLTQTDSNVSLRTPKFDSDVFRELISLAIIKHELPLRFVEYDGIRDAFNYAAFANKEIKLVSRNTAKSDIIKLYQREKRNIFKLLSEVPGKICLTSDLWSSITRDGYISLTAHFINQDWKLEKKLLNYSYMPSPHTGVAICEKIHQLLCEWGLESKVFSITLDNASSNDLFVSLLKSRLNLKDALFSNGEYFHVRCCAHIINLIVQEGLKEIDGAVDKIRESVRYFRGSQGRKEAFNTCVRNENLPTHKGLKQDVPTRWNSTFLMLESAIFYRRAFISLKLSDGNYKNCPSDEEWNKVETISEFLGVFYNVTCIFSGTKYTTSNVYFPQVFLIHHTLFGALKSDDPFMQTMASQMIGKFEKYWSSHNMIFIVAVVLDPRYKLQFVEFCYKQLYGSNSPEMKLIHDKLFGLFDIYAKTYSTAESSSHHLEKSSESSISSRTKRNLDVFKAFDNFDTEVCEASPPKSQLQLYLEEPKLKTTDDIDILAFWNANKYRYPELSLMARDVLAIPISTVASESAFSVGGRVIDSFRSTLKPEIAEALICTHDWIFQKQGSMVSDNIDIALEDLAEDMTLIHIDGHDESVASASNKGT